LHLEEESEDLSTSVLATSLLVVHDTIRSGQDKLTKLTGWKQVRGQLLDLVKSNIKSWGDDTTLVQTTKEVDNDLTGSVIINDLEVTNVA
jgi:hypothetical protein